MSALPGEITLAPMRPEEAACAAAMERECFPDPWSEAGWAGSVASPVGYALSARCGEELCGFLAAQLVIDEGELLRIMVSESFRGRGIGALLLRRMLDECDRTTLWRLDVRAGNEAAIRLYESAGFRKLVRQKNYYEQPREDGWLMLREP